MTEEEQIILWEEINKVIQNVLGHRIVTTDSLAMAIAKANVRIKKELEND